MHQISQILSETRGWLMVDVGARAMRSHLTGCCALTEDVAQLCSERPKATTSTPSLPPKNTRLPRPWTLGVRRDREADHNGRRAICPQHCGVRCTPPEATAEAQQSYQR